MRLSILVLPLVVLMTYISAAESVNIAQRYFITIDISHARINGKYGTDSRRNMRLIEDHLCGTRPVRNSESPVTCFLKFKIIGEPKVIVVIDVTDSLELERRLRSLIRSSNFRYESEPLVDYTKFATDVLRIDPNLAALERNTLKNTPEALWCKFNVIIGDKTAEEIVSVWKQEAEFVLQRRKTGISAEMFKTLGERTIHLLVELDASEFDKILLGTPFNQQIPNTLTTTCKTIVSFDNVLRP